jgi:hypothetical protein
VNWLTYITGCRNMQKVRAACGKMWCLVYNRSSNFTEDDFVEVGPPGIAADVIHETMCCDKGCRRYIPGNRHHDYYQERASVLTAALEPIIGSANVLPVLRIILEEM